MPRAGLDRATIVAAAAAILNREGAEALTLNRLAQELGVKTPSLYNHIDGLPGLYRELARSNARSLGERFTQAAIGKRKPACVLACPTSARIFGDIHDPESDASRATASLPAAVGHSR